MKPLVALDTSVLVPALPELEDEDIPQALAYTATLVPGGRTGCTDS